MAKETVKKEAEKKAETKKKYNNNVHLHGYINDVRMNSIDKDRTAINLDIATKETYKGTDGEFHNINTYHDGVLFTGNKELVKKFEAIAADLAANRENRDNAEYKVKSHTVSLDGILVNRQNTIQGTDQKYDTLQVQIKESSLQLDAKQAEKEVRNRAEIVGNIASINLHEDKGFAVVTVMNHYRPEGSEKEFGTTLQVRVDAERKFSKPMYEAIQKGEMGVGDFIRVGGQLHNNNYQVEAGKKYGMALDVTSSELIKKAAKKEEVKAEVKPEPKKAPAKKAVSRKKNGIRQ